MADSTEIQIQTEAGVVSVLWRASTQPEITEEHPGCIAALAAVLADDPSGPVLPVVHMSDPGEGPEDERALAIDAAFLAGWALARRQAGLVS